MRKSKVKQAKRLLMEMAGEGIQGGIETVFHPKLLRDPKGRLFLSFRTQYINAGMKGAMKMAKKAVRV